eukprot:1143319-Pelagomonas_calceolata.AAC.1
MLPGTGGGGMQGRAEQIDTQGGDVKTEKFAFFYLAIFATGCHSFCCPDQDEACAVQCRGAPCFISPLLLCARAPPPSPSVCHVLDLLLLTHTEARNDYAVHGQSTWIKEGSAFKEPSLTPHVYMPMHTQVQKRVRPKLASNALSSLGLALRKAAAPPSSAVREAKQRRCAY